MTRQRLLLSALAVVWAEWFVPAGHCDQRDTRNMDETAIVPPSPARIAIWTDKLGYLRRRDLVSAYMAIDRADDRHLYREFIYRENIQTGKREYLARDGGLPRLRDGIVDVQGKATTFLAGARLRDLPATKIWSGRMLEAGLWRFVVELRSSDTTEIVKVAHANFVVSPKVPLVLGADGRATEIRTDTTWTNDRIYAVRNHVFVNAGATLTIEPGTLILARGAQAAIVVERGGRIVARGHPDAPIVMTCDEPVGQRFEGCWGGLVVLGNAPTTRGTSLAGGAVPEPRSTYGGHDRLDSSGVLRYVRVEFAGAAGLSFGGIGSGTLIDHVQAHASAGDGIHFSGGTANCMYCVASGARHDALSWSLGWRGTAQHVFLQLSPEGGRSAIAGENDGAAFEALPRSAPRLYNLTLVGGPARGPPSGSDGSGILLHSGSAVTARNAIILGFDAPAIDVRDSSRSLFMDGTSRIGHAMIHANGGQAGAAQINGGLEAVVRYQDVGPTLVNVRYEASPDPRPMLGSPALKGGAGAVPPSDGVLDTSAQYIGAFGDSNWLEGWTFFGSESDYDTREMEGTDD